MGGRERALDAAAARSSPAQRGSASSARTSVRTRSSRTFIRFNLTSV
ncbi:hypothetical protein ACFC6L_15205 [Kitasatospora phosalacinea]